MRGLGLLYSSALWLRGTIEPGIGVLDRLITHLSESLFWADSWIELGKGYGVGVLTALWGRSLSLSFPISLLILYNCLSLTLIYLDSLISLMKLVHVPLLKVFLRTLPLTYIYLA